MLAAVITAKYAPFDGWMSYVLLIVRQSEANLMRGTFTLGKSIEGKVTYPVAFDENIF